MKTAKDVKAEGTQERLDKQLVRGVKYLDRVMAEGRGADVEVTAWRIRAPRDENDDYMVVVTAIGVDGEALVGFHSGVSLAETIAGMCNRVRNGSMRWRPDEYAKTNSG